jgi:D-xylonolactonase
VHWELRYSLNLLLGEGICWAASESSLGSFLCVDIHGRKIIRFAPEPGGPSPRIWHTPERVGWVFPTLEEGVVIAGFQSGIVTLGLSDQVRTIRRLPMFPDAPEMRLNDAMIDPRGVLWAGSLNCEDEAQPTGALYRVENLDSVRQVDQGYCVTNGPALSPDGSLFLHTDSGRRTIYAFDFDQNTSEIRNKRVWRVFGQGEGYPDGMAFDSAGCVWVAHWGSGLISQFAADGLLLQRLALPVSNVTNLAFGGPMLDRLFVTSACCGLSDAQRSAEPMAGSIFEILGHGSTGMRPHLHGEPIDDGSRFRSRI